MKTKLTQTLLAALLGVALTTTLRAQSTNLVLHWALEEGSGTNTTEAVSGVTDVAHLVGGATWTNGLAPGSSHAVNLQLSNPGYVDAGTLQTNGQYVSAASATTNVILGNEWTISGWVELPQGNNNYNDQCILTTDTDGNNWWLFFIRTASQVPNSLGFDFQSTRIDSGLDVPTGKPVFVSISGDGSATAFVAGNKHRFAIWDGHTWQYQEGTQYEDIRLDGLEIGSFNTGTRQFNGTLDDLRIYHQALSKAELASLALNNAIGGDLGVTVTAPAALTNSTSLDFTVQFTEDVQGFDTSDLDIITNGTSLMTGTPVISGSNSTYTVTIPVQGDGPISLDLIPGSGVQTLGGDPLVNHVASSSVDVDQTPPMATAITLIGANPTPALSVGFDVTFSEPVIGFNDSNDVLVAHSGTTNTGVNITGSGTNYVVTLTGVTGDGSFTIALDPAGGTTDLAGNSVSGNATSAPVTHYIDTTPPYVVSITPDSTGPITNGTVNFTVVFSEPVLGFDPYSDLEFDATNMAGVYVNYYDSADGSNYVVQLGPVVADGVMSGTFDARVTLTTNITDLAGNPLGNPDPTSAVVTVSASPYQLWAISFGLAAGVNFSPDQDPDNDKLSNATEFARDDDPLNPNDPAKQQMTIADVAGQKFGVFTIAAPDGFVYETNDVPGELDAFYSGPAYNFVDSIVSSADLLNWADGTAPIIEDPSMATPPGLPALSPGWSYRHFRLTTPTDTLPKAFMKAETFSGM